MDPFTLKKQIKDNAEDLQTYLRDLNTWEADIKRKDAELRGVDVVEASYPEIRSKAAKPKTYDEKPLLAAKNHPKNPRISGFDYSSWDKLDVDKVCDEIDTNEAQKMRETAMYEKERGNAYVKAGNWEKAITCYNKAIKSFPKDAIFFANRALCYLKLKDFQKAECDCTKAIELDAKYVKAWLRRYAARKGLGRLELAKRDLLRVLSLEPRNTEAQSELTTLEKHLKEEEKRCERIIESEESVEENSLTPEGYPEKSDIHPKEVSEKAKDDHFSVEALILPWKVDKGKLIEPIQKPPHLRSKKPLRRIPITEQLRNDLDSGGSDGDGALAGGSQPDGDNVCIQPQVPLLVHCGGSTEIPEPTTSEIPSAPKSSVQFLLAWKTIKLYPEMAVKYLQKISPESLPLIFGDSLEISTLEEILNIIGQKTLSSIPAEEEIISPNKYSTFEFLKNLSYTPRFSTLAMFLSSDEKTITRQLLAFCIKNGECSTEEAADVAYKFML